MMAAPENPRAPAGETQGAWASAHAIAPGSRRGNTDRVDAILLQWLTVRPDLDPSPMGIIGRISQLARYFERSTASVMKNFGINEPQFAVLAALRRAPPEFVLSPTELYESLMVSSGAITNRVDRLEAAGLVRRKSSVNDGRALLVHLTPKGRAVIDRAIEAHLENESRLLERMTRAQREACTRSLRLLLASFESGEVRKSGRGGSPPIEGSVEPSAGHPVPEHGLADVTGMKSQ
jgi:DNA-binding MarR family transcriptional regulator